ncbi:lysophospholipase L1-like esterase [Microbacteriaceae bacterium SG_E_30_P1]|uniref:Lysophospholipase L1-like esterase n=1 Tax=Antiquaquibacter oligotrophicus TaxID=2880260 RepID=A0ABT6KPJ3_9MICO|nr:SGNH/GDSL hydrolase family protein [Antiquaquibacter oligotrophicus]MDH6181017.1 lysophospholipase L1-like esterase [Antiquaquibacter oligotrophicus]UDF13284.1 SGNH/GDSL hydrolase family protein [Antiquaquibacter oligotrophicus]
MPRRTRRRRLAVKIALGAVGTLAVAGLVGVAVFGSAHRVPAPEPSPTDAQTTRTGYTFGGATSTHVFTEEEGILPFIQRMPLQITQDATRFRVHVANQNLRLDEAIPGEVRLGGIWIAPDEVDPRATDNEPSGVLSELPVRIMSPMLLVDGEEYVGPWIDSNRYELDAERFHLLSMAAAFDGTQPVVTTFSGSWISGGADSVAEATRPGEWGNGISLLDIWIEFDYEGRAPTLLVYGSSLSTPGNGGEAPTYGEPDAWPGRWARLADGVALNSAVSMGTIDHYVDDNRLTRRFAEFATDAVVLWTASNSLGRGDPFDQVRDDTQATVDRLRVAHPEAKIVIATEPGRNDFVIPDEYYQDRLRYNEWVRSLPDGVDGFVDLDVLLSDPADNHLLSQEYDSGDLVHLNESGHIAVAEAVDEVLLELGVY